MTAVPRQPGGTRMGGFARLPSMHGLEARRVAASVATLAAATLLLVWPALWNGFPVVFVDSGTYLGQALMRYLGWDRPVFYSFFLLGTHWRLSLWPVVLAQGLCLALVVWLALRALGRRGPLALLVAAAGLATLTGLPWFAAQLTPDVFAGVLVLTSWLLGFRYAALGRAERWLVTALATGAAAVHLTHLPLAFGLALLGGLLLWVRGGPGVAWRGGARMALPAVLATVLVVGVNVVGQGRASLSPYGAVFYAARLIGDGPGRDVLLRRCTGADGAAPAEWRICADRDRVSPHANLFLWAPDSPLWTSLGGPRAWAPEAAALVGATMRGAPFGVVAAALRNMLAQLAMLDTGDGLEPWLGAPGPEPLVAQFFPGQLRAYREARQQRGLLREDARAWAPLHRGAAWAGIASMAAMLAYGLLLRRSPAGVGLCALVLGAALGNAVLAGALSGPHHRYQARLAWLFVFAPAAVALGVPRAVPGLNPSLDPAAAPGGAPGPWQGPA